MREAVTSARKGGRLGGKAVCVNRKIFTDHFIYSDKFVYIIFKSDNYTKKQHSTIIYRFRKPIRTKFITGKTSYVRWKIFKWRNDEFIGRFNFSTAETEALSINYVLTLSLPVGRFSDPGQWRHRFPPDHSYLCVSLASTNFPVYFPRVLTIMFAKFVFL